MHILYTYMCTLDWQQIVAQVLTQDDSFPSLLFIQIVMRRLQLVLRITGVAKRNKSSCVKCAQVSSILECVTISSEFTQVTLN